MGLLLDSPDLLAGLPRAVKPRQRRSLGRSVKIVVALGFLGAGCYALLAQSAYVASDQAVVSAYTLTLRSPVEGYLSDTWLAVGASVARGEMLGHVRNPDADVARLHDLRQRLAQARAEESAAAAEQEALRRFQDDLARRGAAHDGAEGRVLAGQVGEAARGLAARLVVREQQRRESERHATLERTGVTAHAEADRLRAAAAGADHDAEAARFHVESLVAQADAVAHGVMLDGSGNDVSYSRQRADELTIRLAELDRSRVLHTAESVALEESLAAETRRVARLSDAALSAPATGMVWKMAASEGERLAVGDAVAQIVDCRSAFLLVPVPQDRLSDIAVGTPIRFRLAGETLDRLGQVTAVSGESAGALDRTLAAVPPPLPIATGTLRIALASRNETSGCLVGRTAHVLVPAGGETPLRRLGRLFF